MSDKDKNKKSDISIGKVGGDFVQGDKIIHNYGNQGENTDGKPAKKKTTAATRSEIEELVKKDKLQQAIEGMSGYFRKAGMDEERNTCTLLEARLNRLKIDQDKGILTEDRLATETARIRHAILNLAEEMG